jgi:hypothetical protein
MCLTSYLLVDFERGFWNAQQHKRTQILEEHREAIDASDCVRVMPGLTWILTQLKGMISCEGLPMML